MKIDRTHLNEDEIRFLEHITFQHPHPNEAISLFQAVQMSFTFDKHQDHDPFAYPVASGLIESLANCTIISLGFDANDEIPWDKTEYNFVLLKVLQTLLSTAVVAFHDFSIHTIGNDYYLGKFILPKWFAKYAESVAA